MYVAPQTWLGLNELQHSLRHVWEVPRVLLRKRSDRFSRKLTKDIHSKVVDCETVHSRTPGHLACAGPPSRISRVSEDDMDIPHMRGDGACLCGFGPAQSYLVPPSIDIAASSVMSAEVWIRCGRAGQRQHVVDQQKTGRVSQGKKKNCQCQGQIS